MESVFRKEYVEPLMTIRKISFADIIVTSIGDETPPGNGPVAGPEEDGEDTIANAYY